MRFRRMLAVFAVAASLGIGLMHVESASASAIAQTAQAQYQSPRQPDATLKAINVDPKLRCGQFKGTLSYNVQPEGREYVFHYEVSGTLQNKCRGGTAHLRAYWTPDGSSEQNELIGNTRTTQIIKEWSSPGYFVSIRNMFVELCTFGPLGGGCAHSATLN